MSEHTQTHSRLSGRAGGFSLRELNQLSQYSYGVGRADSMTLLGRHNFNDDDLGAYWVLDSLYSPSNGFEGFIVATLTPEGEADYEHIAVVFAGTNIKDDARNDLRATPGTFMIPWKNSFGQADQAEILVQKAIYLAEEHGCPCPHIILSGHSLGAGLAIMKALEHNLTAQVFCAVDPWRVLTPAERQRARSLRSDCQIVDYRLTNDRLTGPLNHFLSGQDNRSARVVWCGTGTDPFCHWLGNFTFDTTGDIVRSQPPEQAGSFRHIRQALATFKQQAHHKVSALKGFAANLADAQQSWLDKLSKNQSLG
ncbi:hypothetical protein KIM372_13000 [Bombiscardovia nodaiensis]|uniref:Fungal lipase-like domain-containing protein n=1 Tax=Bombiscardovia nodaiensis TaxID=2932181 RepID=A0ABM8B9X1_9BIFI|nr:hypothetical protein KIM372_13000 [Bombiscardovia nodaiensis]